MNQYFLIIICAIVLAWQAIFFKMFSTEYRRGFASHFLNNVFFLGIVVLFLLAINGFSLAENPETYIYSSVFGVVWVITMFFYIKAMGMGPTGLVTLFFSFGIVLPIIVDMTVLNTMITVFQVVGLALLFLSFYIGNRPLGDEKKNISPQFIATCTASFVFNGLIMATVKLHQGAMPGTDTRVFVLYGFTVAVLVSAICFAFFHIKQLRQAGQSGQSVQSVQAGQSGQPVQAGQSGQPGQPENEKVSYLYMFKSPRYYITVAGGSVTTAIGNMMMLLIASQVPAAIQFPLMNGGSSLVAAILSIFIFKERLSKRMALVFIVGIAALAIINL